ncbi:hypothetical protein AVEN_50134-1 [Araneus ventricosus]|uniref:Uncharacterized protein n=1 Tax=Araneus ventricosus TaxID=182803 RepID=A0A4Y2DCG5_ARAVE|nr:hypothetical protein AVEN_50134-1 [Araneus ventricosus]
MSYVGPCARHPCTTIPHQCSSTRWNDTDITKLQTLVNSSSNVNPKLISTLPQERSEFQMISSVSHPSLLLYHYQTIRGGGASPISPPHQERSPRGR